MICIRSNEKVFERALLRYGTILSDKEFSGENCIRVREVVMDGKKYFHYMVNGEVKDIVYLGKVDVYRFYFSRYQKELHQMIQNMIDAGMKVKTDEIPFAKQGGGMSFISKLGWNNKYIRLADDRKAEFTQACVGEGNKCDFKDSVLVAEMIGTEKEILEKICRR